jgi:NRE family putative nickel resistance protein-like MFS transporter
MARPDFTSSSAPTNELRSLWRNRDFTLLFAAQVISLVGSGATTIGLALFAYQMAGPSSATVVVGNALTLRIVAFLLFSQPAGVLADRVDRKSILVASDVVRAVLLGLLPFVTTVWQIYALIFVINAVTAFFTPTYEASVPAVVGETQIVKALSVSRIAVDVESVAAPAVAAAIVTVVGARWLFWFDSITYVASAALVVGARIPHVAKSSPPLSLPRFASEITYGVRAIVRQPALVQSIVMSFVEALAGAVAIVATVAYVRNVLGRGEAAVAVAMAAVGFGSAGAALALGRVTGRHERGTREKDVLHGKRHQWSRRALLTGGAVLGAVLLPGVLVPPFAVLVVLWALNGAGQALISIPSSTLLAEHTFEEERGKVYAAQFALTHACWLVTYPAVGHLAAWWGAPATFTAAGGVCLVVTMGAALYRGTTSSHVHEHSPS